MTFHLDRIVGFALACGIAATLAIPAQAQKKGEHLDCPGGKPVEVNGNLEIKDACKATSPGTYDYGDKNIRIKSGGSLEFADADIDFMAASIVVEDGGTMAAGSATPIGPSSTPGRPYRVMVQFQGDRSKIVAAPDDCSAINKGIAVMSGGTLRLIGSKGVPDKSISWTQLAKAAGPKKYEDATNAEVKVPASVAGLEGRRLELARNVTTGSSPWKIGDWIVIATTSYSPFESEFAQIESFDGTAIILKTPLKYYHFGGADPGEAVDSSAAFGAGKASLSFSGDHDHNYGVDERAEVGLISRNILLTAETADGFASPSDTNRNWGGETKFCHGFKEVTIEGVEIEKFGKDLLGSYPIHFHHAHDVTGKMLVSGNSVHHSYNKCMTIHTTSNAVLQNNVCARVTGHAFYTEIGDETNTNFNGNLVVGAMNNNFGLPNNATSAAGYWDGDNMAVARGYTGLGIPNMDNQSNATHGRCFSVDNNNGLLTSFKDPPCDAGFPYYTEPPTGFWIINPTAILEGNSVAGCQGTGRGYWYVPTESVKSQPVGKFRNNRVHGCYDGIFGEEDDAVVSKQLFPTVDGNPKSRNVIARFEGFTATRIRNRGAWMRPLWNVFENARVATSREGIALVTSGGLDGNGPGVWALLKNSVVIGLSTNNVDRWGPCSATADLGSRQELAGCVDFNKNSKEIVTAKRYPGPGWNFAGFYIYDGPVRIHDTRFIRYQVDPSPLMTVDDQAVLKRFTANGPPYEGDAALGWFNANKSAYPTATEVKGLRFEETTLRHQIFTDKVNLSSFQDGDKNTAVIDIDGSLTGFTVLDKQGQRAAGHHPISLNNLPFNAYSNAVDECLAMGAQDEKLEGRPTSLISPGNMATLEFGSLTLPNGLTVNSNGQVPDQMVTFTRDSGVHDAMTLNGRNGQGIWEPKVASGLGYTVRASSGIPKTYSVALTDAVKANMSVDPFYVRVGVCYTNAKGSPPPNPKFTIARGYRSWGGNGTEVNDILMRQSFNKLTNMYKGQYCDNLDAQARDVDGKSRNLQPLGCPAQGVVIKTGACPAGSTEAVDADAKQVCVFDIAMLGETTLDGLAPGGKPDLTKYHYDNTSGMLYFYVAQNQDNAMASSPLGSCVDSHDSSCPEAGESFYGCPAQGCATYTVEMDDATYVPGGSACGGSATDSTAIYYDDFPAKTKPSKFVLAEPADPNVLGYVPPFPTGINATTPVTPQTKVTAQGYLHRIAVTPPVCKVSP